MTLRFIILGILSNKPMTGYDLKNFFNKSINYFWSAELSQIYRELSKLEKMGYIRYKLIPQDGRPDKKVYSTTDEGENIFSEWLKDFPHNLTPISRNEFLARIFFSSKISNDELIFHLNRYVKQMEEDIKIYDQIERKLRDSIQEHKDEKKFFYQKLTVRRGLYFAQSEINWAKECIEEIKKLQDV